MWLTWGALCLLVVDGAIEATGMVDFTATAWVLTGATLVAAVLGDLALGKLRETRTVVPARVAAEIPQPREPQRGAANVRS